MPLRVCDRCISKKVKCNQARPSCSRCLELGETCEYTSTRRKPGPQRGSRYITRTSKTRDASDIEPGLDAGPDVLQLDVEYDSPRERLPTPTSHPTPSLSISCPSLQSRTASRVIDAAAPLFSATDEACLIKGFLGFIQDANPIFAKARFFDQYSEGRHAPDLILTMALLSAMLDPSFQSHRIAELQLKFESLLSASLLDDEFAEDNPSLDQFRKSYLLAFYEFHQFPGHRSWLRISRVTRMAYHVGLDRLDFIASQSTEWAAVSDDDMREWRRLWWCLYRLDTYSNLASGAPYLINDDLMNTSFNQDPTADNPQKILLPTTCEQLSNVLPAIIADAHTSTENIHNITVSVLRQAGAATRLHLVQLPDGIASRVASVERQLAILHLSLPTGWLNPRRRAFSNESPEEHHGRIITVFHIRMAHLLLAIVACGHRQAGDWMTNWQRVLEACQDIATLASQWDSAFCNIVDPAITFTTFTALVFLDMHQKFDITMDYDLLNSIHHGITIMHLQLKHFGSLWTQAKLLALSFESFSQAVKGPLSYQHIALILSRFEAPLHPRWLKFLQSAESILLAAAQV